MQTYEALRDYRGGNNLFCLAEPQKVASEKRYVI